MKRCIVILSWMLVFALSAFPRDKTDVLIMKNGDHMTGEIKGLDSGVLYVSFDYVDGTSSVDWSKVARVESRQLFLVKTQDGSVYIGTIRTPETTSEEPIKIEVLQTEQPSSALEQSEVVQMIATSDKFLERFNGEVSLGVIYSKGNQSTQYSLGSETVYVRERWNAQAAFASNLSSSAGANVSTRNSLSFGARHLLPWNKWFYSGLGTFLQSSEQGIALQSTLGGGLGRYLKDTNRTTITLLGGMAWQNTHYNSTGAGSTVPTRENVAAGLLYTEARLFKFSKTNLDLSAALLPAMSDPGRVWFNTNASYYIKIVSNLKWNVSFYGNWDSRPPHRFSGSDYGTSSGLSWTFGLK